MWFGVIWSWFQSCSVLFGAMLLQFGVMWYHSRVISWIQPHIYSNNALWIGCILWGGYAHAFEDTIFFKAIAGQTRFFTWVCNGRAIFRRSISAAAQSLSQIIFLWNCRYFIDSRLYGTTFLRRLIIFVDVSLIHLVIYVCVRFIVCVCWWLAVFSYIIVIYMSLIVICISLMFSGMSLMLTTISWSCVISSLLSTVDALCSLLFHCCRYRCSMDHYY